MRGSFLQYLYLQRPVALVVAACAVGVLPWIGVSDFSTKGEAREALVSVGMLESGDWVLPEAYADEFAHKPPLLHWMVAGLSLVEGRVTEGMARLPSAVGYMVLMGVTLFFFGRRIRFQEAFIGVLLLLTCVEMHRAGLAARVDMLLTCFMVLGMFGLYRWENKLGLKGLPVGVALLLGCAALTKGPVGVALPLLVFGVHLLLLGKYGLGKVLRSVVYVGVASLFLPLIWYVAAWQEGGEAFVRVALAENVGRFFHWGGSAVSYELGHENGVWYNGAMLLAGFVPWSLAVVLSLFGMKWGRFVSLRELGRGLWRRFRGMEKLKRFSLVALCCIVAFYCVPSGKRGVYLLPAYPFVSLFLAEYMLYLIEYRSRVVRWFAGVMAAAAAVVLAMAGLAMGGVVELSAFAGKGGEAVQFVVGAVEGMLRSPDWKTMAALGVVAAAFGTVVYQLTRKTNLKMLYAVIFLTFAINLVVDGVVMRGVHRERTCRPFAERIRREYPLDEGNMYVMNDLREYRNLYGLNFYLRSRVHNFEKTQPGGGYLLICADEMERLLGAYGDRYAFRCLTTDDGRNETGQRLVLAEFRRKGYEGNDK